MKLSKKTGMFAGLLLAAGFTITAVVVRGNQR